LKIILNKDGKLTHPKKMNLSGISECHAATIPSDLTGKELEEDLVIGISPFNEESSWYAAAGACYTDSNNRPMVGAVYLNFYHIVQSKPNDYYIPLVFIHELMHVMGFSNYFFSLQNILGYAKIGGQDREALVSDGVVNYAKEYFGCNEIVGVPLENDGGSGSAGSHFEKTMFPSEVMNPQVAYPATISMFTVKVLEDLGWYRGVEAQQRYTYLKGDGCHTIKGGECSSDKSDEFCSAEQMGHDHCYPNKLGKASCSSNSWFMDSCGHKSPTYGGLCTGSPGNYGLNFNFESYGPHSRCLMTEKTAGNYDAACLRMRCTQTNVEIQFGSEVHTCQSTGVEEVFTTVYTGKIECPSFQSMCPEVLDHRCPLDCHGQGLCMANKTCQCFSTFTGEDCNDNLPKEEDPFVTNYDIRKKSPENPDSPQDPENPEEDDQDNEEEKDEEKEENEEEQEDEREEETEEPEEATRIKESIIKFEKKLDYWTVGELKGEWNVKKGEVCEEKWGHKSCQKMKNFGEKQKSKSQGKKDIFVQKINDLENKLLGVLTTKQIDNWKFETQERQISRGAERKTEYKNWLIKQRTFHQEKYEKRAELVEKLTHLTEQYTEFKPFVRRLRKIIEGHEVRADFHQGVVEMTDKEFDDETTGNSFGAIKLSKKNSSSITNDMDGDKIHQGEWIDSFEAAVAHASENNLD